MAVRGQPYGKPAKGLERMRQLLEGAMAYGYDIRVVYRGQVYEGQIRPSQYNPLSRFQLKDSRAVEYLLAPWREAYDPEREGWMELFIDLEVLTEVRSSGGDPYDD